MVTWEEDCAPGDAGVPWFCLVSVLNAEVFRKHVIFERGGVRKDTGEGARIISFAQ